MSTGIVVFAHGSSVETANEAVRGVARDLARDLARDGGFPLVEAAFLEQGKPNLAGAVSELVGHGARHVLVVPYFLTLGMHLQRDLPRLVDQIRALHSGIEIEVTGPLDGHPALGRILLDRTRQGIEQWRRQP